MNEVKDLNGKRVCDISNNQEFIEIRKKNCITRIIANLDGTLSITHEHINSLV